MLKLRQFQQFGHEVTFLIGTMTGIVGDPSDKTAARQMLTLAAVEANSETWLRQAFRVLDKEETVVRRNGDWLAPMTFGDVVDLASNFTVAQFLNHETYRRRLDEGKPLYLHEFIYALMQAYDAYFMETDVQVGGVEQLFNIMAGRQLQHAKGKRPLTPVCLPILTGTDGHLRMSKSTGNYIGLDDAPADMYGKVMSIPDALMPNYYTLLTDTSAGEIASIEAGLAGKSKGKFNPMETKKRLARSVVALLHGDAAATEAQLEFERVFQRREDPVENATEFAAIPGPTDVSQLLVAAGIASSRSEARRLVSQGGVEVDGAKVETPQVELKDGSLVRVGRHRFLRIVDASKQQ
jgi:tyrosyl-tRNA synthetase